MTQSADRFLLDLANALTCQVEAGADLFEGVGGRLAVEREPPAAAPGHLVAERVLATSCTLSGVDGDRVPTLDVGEYCPLVRP